MRLFLAMAIAAALACCAPPQPDPGETDSVVVAGVPPFAAQVRDDDCASVALASLMAYYGRQVPPARIDQAVYDPVLRGSLLFDLENFAAGQGLTPHSGRGDLDFLRDRLAAGTPVLLPIDLGMSRWRRPHYVVVFGYGPRHFLMHERQGEPTRRTAEDLERRWSKAGSLYLYLDDAS